MYSQHEVESHNWSGKRSSHTHIGFPQKAHSLKSISDFMPFVMTRRLFHLFLFSLFYLALTFIPSVLLNSLTPQDLERPQVCLGKRLSMLRSLTMEALIVSRFRTWLLFPSFFLFPSPFFLYHHSTIYK